MSPSVPAATRPGLSDVRLRGGYFGPVIDLVKKQMLPFQWKVLNNEVEDAEKSNCVENFRIAAGLSDGEFHGMVFQDSDLAKWLEAAAYVLAQERDPHLEALCDEAIALVEKAQMPDGYLNTYYQCTGIDKRWTNLRDNHELYCAGHMLEAAVAYKEATGKDSLLQIMRRYVAHIRTVLGPGDGRLHGYPGHEEMELALCRLYQLTGDKEALELARYFIDQRGQEPHFFVEEAKRRGDKHLHHGLGESYNQSHLPAREQQTLEGHSVRALYLLTGMAALARETADPSLQEACRRLLHNVLEKRMYITGGVGSTHVGEAFSLDYDLPGDTAYAETCASIALIFALGNMLLLEPDSAYADAMERALYNTCMAGMALDGQHFFYVNPLEVWPEASEKDPGKRHVLPVRPKWFGCACCPPNLARLLLSLGAYQYQVAENEVRMHLYLSGDAALSAGGQKIRLSVETAYPNDGAVKITAGSGNYRLLLRIPGWCQKWKVSREGKRVKPRLERGYAVLEGPFKEGETIFLDLAMRPSRNYADLRVRDCAGRVAVSVGPVVYCLEGIDNGEELHTLVLPRDAKLKADFDKELLGGTPVVDVKGMKEIEENAPLYHGKVPDLTPARLRFIPYARWANRGENEMTVWVRELR